MPSRYSKPNMGLKASLYSRLSDPRLEGQFFDYKKICDMMRSEYPEITLSTVSKVIMQGVKDGSAPWTHTGKGLIRAGFENGSEDNSSPAAAPAKPTVENFLLMKRLARLDDGTLLVQDDDTMKVYSLKEMS